MQSYVHATCCTQSAVDYASSLGDAGGVAVFIATYVVATVLLVPGSLITLAAGALYGG